MSYASRQDLIDRFGERELIQLTDRTHKPQTTVDDTVVDRALGDADGVIDGYLGAAGVLPLAQVPPVLVRVACDLARFFLHGKAAEKDGPVDRANTAAISWLRDVAKGTVRLTAADGETTPVIGDGGVRINPPTRVMNRDTLRDL